MNYFRKILNQPAGVISKGKWQGADMLVWAFVYLLVTHYTGNSFYGWLVSTFGIIIKEQFDDDFMNHGTRHLFWNKSIEENSDSVIDIAQAMIVPTLLNALTLNNAICIALGLFFAQIFFWIWVIGNLIGWTHEGIND